MRSSVNRKARNTEAIGPSSRELTVHSFSGASVRSSSMDAAAAALRYSAGKDRRSSFFLSFLFYFFAFIPPLSFYRERGEGIYRHPTAPSSFPNAAIDCRRVEGRERAKGGREWGREQEGEEGEGRHLESLINNDGTIWGKYRSVCTLCRMSR